MISTKDYRHDVRILDGLLIDFLRNLPEQDWNKKTVAGSWTIKDVAAHLLDGNLRILSALRDGYAAEKVNINSYPDLVAYLNRLNADWVQAMKRISPRVLVELLNISGKEYCDYYNTLNLQDFAAFSVAWAGEEKSYNSFHIAREFTEKFHHQQQIRDAVGDYTLLQHPYYYDFLSILLLGMPHTLKDVTVSKNASLCLRVIGFQTFQFYFSYTNGLWKNEKQTVLPIIGTATLPDTLAWKLFTKSIRPESILNDCKIEGDKDLAFKLLTLIAVMA